MHSTYKLSLGGVEEIAQEAEVEELDVEGGGFALNELGDADGELLDGYLGLPVPVDVVPVGASASIQGRRPGAFILAERFPSVLRTLLSSHAARQLPLSLKHYLAECHSTDDGVVDALRFFTSALIGVRGQRSRFTVQCAPRIESMYESLEIFNKLTADGTKPPRDRPINLWIRVHGTPMASAQLLAVVEVSYHLPGDEPSTRTMTALVVHYHDLSLIHI